MFFCNVLIVIAAFYHLSEAAKYGEVSKREYYFKVPEVLPSVIKNTMISSTNYPDGRISLKYICFQKCSTEPDCALVCLEDNICKTYYALLSVYWLSSDHPDTLEVFAGNCYSNWKFPNDITSKIVSSARSSFVGNYHAENTINGFYAYNNSFIFHSACQSHPWVRYDFEGIVKITKILLKTRRSPYVTNFANILVKLGNTTTSYSQVGQCCSTMARAGDEVVFSMCEAKYAKYIMIQDNSPSNVYLTIADIKVIG